MKPKNTCAISLSVTKCSRLALVSLASCSATLLWAGPPGETDGASVLPLPLRVNATTRMSSPAWPSPGLTLHVAPRGNDTGDGSAKKPFASLERARDEIRARRKSGSLPGGGVAVLVHGGEYQVSQTFLISESDSGTEAEPLVFRAVAGEKPIFRGGTRLMGWRKLSDADGYPQLPSESRPKVWIMDLHGQGITNLLPLKLGGFASGNGFRTHPAHELFFNGQAMSLARGPNEGFLHISQVAVKDGTKGYECEGSKTGKFYCDSDRLRQWVNEPDLLLYGYWFWDWADSYERVATIDPEQRLIILAQSWHTYGFSAGAPFYAVNALSELDVPGEWYLDRNGDRVLLYPPSDPRIATIEMSRFDAPMVNMENVSWVSFTGLTRSEEGR